MSDAEKEIWSACFNQTRMISANWVNLKMENKPICTRGKTIFGLKRKQDGEYLLFVAASILQ